MMSLVGVKIYITDSATALSSFICPILFQTEFPPATLPKDSIKSLIRTSVLSADVWWCGKPYVKVVFHKDMEKTIFSQFKLKRVHSIKHDVTHYLIDICDVTKELPIRLMRAKDLECSFEAVFITENQFHKAALVKDIVI